MYLNEIRLGSGGVARENILQVVLVVLCNVFGRKDAHLIGQSGKPAVKLRADCDIGADKNVVFVVRAKCHIRSKAINDDTGKGAVTEELHRLLFSCKHAKGFLGVCGNIDLVKCLPSIPWRIGLRNVKHFIYAIVLHLLRGGVVGHQVIILVIPGQKPWAHLIKGSIQV